ncbi:MAG: Tex family protein [Eubacteriaceae bacterium]|nr:Tex family protein [Eubacteriaceae bacterium]
MNITEKIAADLHLQKEMVEKTVSLIDDGNTIPFIARYRKEVTGGMSDVELRDLGEKLTYLRSLEERKEEVLRLIEEQGKLTAELKQDIVSAEVLQRVEDLYKPYKQKKTTRAAKAREKGLGPLADMIMEQKEESGLPEEYAKGFISENVEDETAALEGACDIIAENIADDTELTQMAREKTLASGIIVSEAADPEEKTVYEQYYEYSEKISKIPNHRVLAINRGENEKKLKVKVDAPDDIIKDEISKAVIINDRSVFKPLLGSTIEDSYKRLTAPSLQREMRSMLTERAEAEAVKIFGKNTESLLMVPPVKGTRIISIDPGYRTGCKVAVLNETGKLLAYTTVYPTQPRRDVKGTEATLKKLADKYKINTIVIGNGTGGRETEEIVAGFIKKTGMDIKYTIVNEAGASVYSASKLAAEEYPDLDVTTRGAMSLGRRLQDPLAELVKVPIKSIGVGQYQHDINQKLLEGELDNVVENCVNRVGVDLNTASPSLLSHIAGINGAIAKNIVEFREKNGRFTSRTELKKVARLGPKAYDQCAGFMRISEGKDPLDGTSVHPESYKAARALLDKLDIDRDSIGNAGDIEERICRMYAPENKKEVPKKRVKGLDALKELNQKPDDPKKDLKKAVEKLAADLDIGVPTLRDIVDEIKKPGRDPREDAPGVVFRNDVKSIDDMEPGMEMTGTVRNVVDFGAFVDVGVKNDGLVHISQLSDKYVSHPMDVVSVGDTVNVRIIDIDREKGKISLTMKKK